MCKSGICNIDDWYTVNKDTLILTHHNTNIQQRYHLS